MTKHPSAPPDDATSNIVEYGQVTYPTRSRYRRKLSPCTPGVAILSTAFVSALLASAPLSDALVAKPGGLLRPLTAASAARAAASRGESPKRDGTRRYANSDTTPSAAATVFGCLRSTPANSPRRCECRRGPSMALGVGGEDHGPEAEGEDSIVEGTVVEEVVKVEKACQGQEMAPDVASVPASRRSNSSPGKGKKNKTGRARLQGEALRDELIQRERVEEEKVLAVNTQFYRARAYKEIDDLKEVWDDSELSECIRNVGGILRGYDDIIEDYKTEFILGKRQEKPGLRPFKIRNLKVQTSGTLAWVTCIEDMRNPYKPYPKTVQLVTNVFRKGSNGWRLTRHHASDRDMSVNRGGAQGDGSSSGSSGINISSLLGDKQSNSDGDGQSGNNLLSHFVDENGQVTQVSARMFRVSDGEIRPVDISELTGRGDENDSIIPGEVSISESDDDDDEDDDESNEGDEGGAAGPLPHWLRKMIQDKVKAMDKKDLKDIIRRRQSGSMGGEIQSEPLKEGIHWEYRDGLPVIFDHPLIPGDKGDKQQWSDGRRADAFGKRKRRGNKGSIEDDDDSDGFEGREEEERGREGRRSTGGRSGAYGKKLTRETVEAVKKLASAGKIKEREKQLLLAHVIRTASWYSPSNIEMALEVLMNYEDDRDFDVVECEEFVDQCKAYAAELTEEQKRIRRRWWWKFWTRG